MEVFVAWFFSKTGALFKAIRQNDVATVKKLLAEGVDPNKPDSDKQTPLMAATIASNIEIVRELLRAKADVNQVSKDPLNEAVAGYESWLMRRIAVNENEWTPLQKAAQRGYG
jgi:ankyrin repeat protein